VVRGTRFSYYPGCSLRTKAKNLDDSTKAVATALGVELDELHGWVCCGAVPPLVTDNVMNLLAPVRNLASAEKRGNELVTTCAFCYNILKRSNAIIREDAEKREKINSFIEENYTGNIRVLHLLEVLRDEIGFEAIKERIQVSLKELSVAPYYGCLLLRPYEIIRLDNPENPRILEDLARSLGCTVIDFPYRNECCGSYLAVNSKRVAVERAGIILTAAARRGVEAVMVSCPLCHFNLDYTQDEVKEVYRGFTEIPILYFTQIIGVALGLSELCGLDQHYVDPRPLLKAKGFIG
jgi:heterodisulfide reductase subunit B